MPVAAVPVRLAPLELRMLMELLRRALADQRGQDLVEYTLLGATVAFAGLLAMSTFGTVINTVYTSWETVTDGLWYPQPPAP